MTDLPPRVSVIIAAKNAASWLDEQLDALAGQVYQGAIEVLVCDNGSTDQTRELVLRRSSVDRRFRLVDASGHPGPGYARNVGVSEASGDVIAFCDADDVVAAGWVQVMATAAAAQDVVVAGRMSTEALNPAWARMVHQVTERPSGTLHRPYAGAGNLAMRRQIFQAVGGFNAEHVAGCEDVDLCWRLQEAGYALSYEPDAVVQVRLRQSVRGIFRQGYVYGSGFAALECRFDLADQAPSTSYSAEQHDPEPTSENTLIQILTRPGRGSWGAALWQLGWHLGYRSAARTQPAALPAVLPAAPSRALPGPRVAEVAVSRQLSKS